jgi:hypothetical protein
MARWHRAALFLTDLRRIDIQRRDTQHKLAAAVLTVRRDGPFVLGRVRVH